jgi:prepilin-type processing-associated H-X9-DG protein
VTHLFILADGSIEVDAFYVVTLIMLIKKMGVAGWPPRLFLDYPRGAMHQKAVHWLFADGHRCGRCAVACGVPRAAAHRLGVVEAKQAVGPHGN